MDLVAKIQAAGPEVLQYERAQAAFLATLVGQPVFNHQLAGHPALPWVTADVASPQRFAAHPVLKDALSGAVIGEEVSNAHLPGRQPPAGWDGEGGSSSPVRTIS